MGTCYYTSFGSVIPTSSRTRGRRPCTSLPQLHPVAASLLYPRFLPKSRPTLADAFSNRMPGRRSLFSVFFVNQNKAFPRGRSSKGRSIALMGLEPAVVSERPYDQSG